MTDDDAAADFEVFLGEIEPGLRRALAGHLQADQVPDALAEAFAYAWQHWNRVRHLDNPGGYLFRVAQSRSRSRRQGWLHAAVPPSTPSVEPALATAMRALPPQQRSAVWLVHGCGWTYGEVATALDISASAVGTHVTRALARLRGQLGVVHGD